MQQSTACILRGVQRRCVWAVGRLGVAACVAAAAVDRQARQCLVWRCGLSRPDKCVLRRSASGGRTAPPDTDTERTCLAVGPTQFTPPHQTRQNSPVCVVSVVLISFHLSANPLAVQGGLRFCLCFLFLTISVRPIISTFTGPILIRSAGSVELWL